MQAWFSTSIRTRLPVVAQRARRYTVVRLSTPLVAALWVLFPGIVPASAAYPERTITLIVPFAPGGSTDTIARIVGEHMAKTLGHAIIIENDAGAGGTTSTTRAARAGADGYTLMM